MKCSTILTVALISVTFALDLETVQKNSQRHYGYPLPTMEKRRIQMPTYSKTFRDHKDEHSGRLSDTKQYYKRVQELLANMISQESRRDAHWIENLRQQDANLRHMTDVRPRYDQEDFPAYGQMSQEETVRWASPLPQPMRPPRMEKREGSYRSHKQFPCYTRVPQEEMVKKRSVDSDAEADKTAEFKQISSTKSQKNEGSRKVSKVGNKVASTEQDLVNATGGGRTSPDQFQRWLTDEYYRNMAMSFTTMRKKRSIVDQSAEMNSPAPRDEGVAFDKLRLMEQSLLQDAICQLLQGPGRHSAKQKTQISGKLDVARDIESLKRDLQNYLVDAQKLKAIEEDQIMAAFKEAKKEYALSPAGEKPSECPELQMLLSGCAALRGMFPPDFVQEQFIVSCNWHEVCYACGAQHGISTDQCDQSFLRDMKFLCDQLGTCDPQLISSLLEPLHKNPIVFKRSVLPVCERSCVVDFLARA